MNYSSTPKKERWPNVGPAEWDCYSDPQDFPAPSESGLAPLTGEISHSLDGILVLAPDLTPVNLLHTRFRHNRFGLRYGSPNFRNVGGIYFSHVLNCSFDSDPAYFKLPLAGTGAYSYSHVDLNYWHKANATRIAGNRFAHSMLGVANAIPDKTSEIGPYNAFDSVVVAGVYFRTVPTKAGAVTRNRFTFPPRNLVISATQWANFMQVGGYAEQEIPPGPTGVYLGLVGDGYDVVLQVTDNEFNQPADFYTFPNPATDATGQAGVRLPFMVGEVLVRNNTFRNLSEGVNANQRLRPATLVGNTFTNCAVGLHLDGRSYQAAPILKIWADCNTFSRVGATLGLNVGILVKDSARIEFGRDNAGSNPLYQVARNLFAGSPPAGPGNTFVYLKKAWGTGSPIPANRRPIYRAFDAINSANTTGTNYHLLASLIANSTNFNLSGLGFNLPYSDDWSCRSTDSLTTGYQPLRPGATSVLSVKPDVAGFALAQNVPNPAAGTTTVGYGVPPGATRAEIWIRELALGGVVKRFVVNPTATAVTLDLQGLRPGVYTYSLVVEGSAVRTRRIVVTP